MFSKYFRTYVILFFLFGISQSFLLSQSNAIPNQTSNISFKLSIPLSAIEDAINQNLPQVLYEDNSFTDNENDNMMTKITKSGNIKVYSFNRQLMGVEIPLNVWVNKRVGTLGLYTNKTFDFKMKMYCTISGEIDDSGNLKTHTYIQRFDFEKEPIITIAGVQLSLTSYVEDELNDNKVEYAKTIDNNISENIPLQQMLLDLLQYFSQPFKASDDYNAWIDYTCQKMQYTPFVIQNDKIETQINLISYLKIYLNEVPMSVPEIKYLPYIESQPTLPLQSQINSFISIPKKEATLQANALMAGEEFQFKDEKYRIALDSVQIDTQENELSIILDTSLDFEGTITLSGTPFYEVAQQTIYLQNPKFKAKTRNKIYEVALWMKKGSIQRQIAEEYGFPVSENLKIIREGLDDYLNTSYYDAIYLSGKTQDFDITNIRVTNNGLLIYYKLIYDLSVELKSLKSF